jgi:hypothetical protein
MSIILVVRFEWDPYGYREPDIIRRLGMEGEQAPEEDNTVLEYFRALVDKAGGGNYQTLINDALVASVQQRSTLDAVRRVMREELASHDAARRPGPRSGSEARKARRSGP